MAVLALLVLVLALPAAAHESGPLPVARLAGGGPAADDCLGALEVVGAVASRPSRLVCRDGEAPCDRDGLVNGRCELWVRACVNGESARCATRPLAAAAVEGAGDGADLDDVAILGRTLELLPMPSGDAGRCGALTTLTVPLGARRNGSPRAGRRAVRLAVTAADGARDVDAVTFVCKPPAREARRHAITFRTIQKRVFEKSCAASGCHGLSNPQGGLVLQGAGAYEALVDRLATASAAKFAGKKLVVPGAPETSFLIDKLRGRLAPGEGDPMPLGRSPLDAGQIEAIRKWIQAGAPRERAVGGRLRGAADAQPRIPPPTPPPGGFQAHLTPFPLGDLPETEGCQMARLDNPEPIFAGAWELFMHEGSHHFILRAYRCSDADGDGLTDCDGPGFDDRFPTGFRPCEEFGYDWAFVIGSQTPHYLVDYQTAATGVAFPLHRRQPVLLNSHYTNPYADTQAEVWVNVTPVDPSLVRHPARILFEVVANAFIRVPPGARGESRHHACAFAGDLFCSLVGEAAPAAGRFALLGITSHMHKRSGKFVADLWDAAGGRVSRGADDMLDADDGSRHLYVSTEYADPVNLAFWPPIVVERGQKLTYACFQDNGVTQPVRLGCEETPGVPPGRSIVEAVLDGADPYAGAARWCRADADCAGVGTGRCVPANLVFGALAEDDMCILPGLYYPCPDGGPCGE